MIIQSYLNMFYYYYIKKNIEEFLFGFREYNFRTYCFLYCDSVCVFTEKKEKLKESFILLNMKILTEINI